MKAVATLALILMLAPGCMTGREHKRPNIALPASFSENALAVAETNAPTNLAEWWAVFGDERLSQLIRDAASTSLDNRMALARVREARALRGVARSAFFPQASGRGQYGRQRASRESFAGQQLAAAGQDLENNLFDSAIDMSWEIDIFGARRREAEAAQAQLDAAVEFAREVSASVAAEVALNYLDHRGAQKELEVLRNNLRSQEETLMLTRDRRRAGLSSELDEARAEAQVSATRSLIPPLEEVSQRAAHRLGVLLGKPPAALEPILAAKASFPSHPLRVPAGLPSDLLRQRPDLRRAERELAAASAELAAAVAQWFPRFYLTGAAGLQSVEAGDFLTSGARFWSIGPGIRWPIFNAGRIRQDIAVRTAREEQALLQFERALLISLEEAENAFLAFGLEQERHAALAESESAQRRAVALAADRYRSGLSGFLEVLDAERSLLAAQDDLVQSERRLAQNLVRVFKALGGGWNPQA